MTRLSFLTTSKFFKGWYLSKLGFFFGKITEDMDIPGYTFVRMMKKGVNGFPSTVLYQQCGKKYVARVLFARRNTLGYMQVMHEASILEVLQSFRKETEEGYTFRFPKVVDVLCGDNRIVLIKEFIEGETIESFSLEDQLDIFRKSLSFFQEITHKLKPHVRGQLPKRSNMLMVLSFPVYVFAAWTRDIFHPSMYLKSCFTFMKQIRYADVFSSNYVLAHKDLQPRNIITSGNEIVIIDMEICVLAESGTDLARSFFAYWKRCGQDMSMLFFESLKLSSDEKRRFLILTCFLIVQLLAMSSRNIFRDTSDDTIDIDGYLKDFVHVIYPAIRKQI